MDSSANLFGSVDWQPSPASGLRGGWPPGWGCCWQPPYRVWPPHDVLGPRQGQAKAKFGDQVCCGRRMHIDTFDPSPTRGRLHRPLKNPIPTNVEGIKIANCSRSWPKQATSFPLRSMITAQRPRDGGYMADARAGGQVYRPSAPWLADEGYSRHKGLIPPYIRGDAAPGTVLRGGLLGGLQAVATGATRRRPVRRGGRRGPRHPPAAAIDLRELLHKLGTLEHAMENDPQLTALDQCRTQARPDPGDAARSSICRRETSCAIARRTTFGQSCLLARRWSRRRSLYDINYGGWDTHKATSRPCSGSCRVGQGPGKPAAGLSDHGLLESTIVWCCGEFAGRPAPVGSALERRPNHFARSSPSWWPAADSRGPVVGSSNEKGRGVKNDRSTRWTHRQYVRAVGLDTEGKLPHPQGQLATVLPPPQRRGHGRTLERNHVKAQPSF